MKYETVGNLTIPKIGFGTWTIGGERSADPAQDERSLAALRSALELGYTHFDTAEGYAAGHAEELLGRAIAEMRIPRARLFITTKVSPDHLGYADVLQCCENSLRRLGMEYVDLYLIHWPRVGANYAETFRALNQLVRQGRVRHLGVSNFKLPLLKKAAVLSETPLLANQVPYSIPDRTYVKNGRMTGGFAMIAWPAVYQSSGIMSFIVGPDGDIYQKDLGPETGAVATRTSVFDPDLSWTRVVLTKD